MSKNYNIEFRTGEYDGDFSYPAFVELQKMDLRHDVIGITVKFNSPIDGLENFPNLKELTCLDNNKFLTSFEKIIAPQLKKLHIIENMHLTSIKGIEKLVSLKSVNISCNKIESIEGVQFLKNLEFFDCSDNEITSLKPLNSEFPKLWHLNISGNEINDLKDLEKLQSLTEFDCCGFSRKNLEGVGALKNLIILRCSGSELESLKGIEGLKALKSLDVQANNLTSLEGIETLTNLEQLECMENRITSLKGIENLTKMKILYCCDNNITSIEEVVHLKNLMEFNFSDNNVNKIPLGITTLRRIRVFDFEGNNIATQEIEPAVRNYLQRFVNYDIKANRVYNDKQNVHNSHICSSIKNSIVKIFESPKLDHNTFSSFISQI
jgi:Leucine-rich repeat (LRR) protein